METIIFPYEGEIFDSANYLKDLHEQKQISEYTESI